MANVVSLYDKTGIMLRPWAEAGHTCFMFDIQNEHRDENVGSGVLKWRNGNLKDVSLQCDIANLKPIFISSFTPCDDMAVCGAKHFEGKLKKNPYVFEEALELAMVTEKVAAISGMPPYMVENPVSILATLWRKPDYRFNPCMYGGYLPIDDVHPLYPEYLPPRDAYNKLTCIWGGNGFVMPDTDEVEPVGKDYPGWSKLGGKSLKTKNIRSATPRGFAKAVFLYNSPP